MCQVSKNSPGWASNSGPTRGKGDLIILDSYPPSIKNDPEKEKNYCPHHFSKVSLVEFFVYLIVIKIVEVPTRCSDGLGGIIFARYTGAGVDKQWSTFQFYDFDFWTYICSFHNVRYLLIIYFIVG